MVTSGLGGGVGSGSGCKRSRRPAVFNRILGLDAVRVTALDSLTVLLPLVLRSFACVFTLRSPFPVALLALALPAQLRRTACSGRTLGWAKRVSATTAHHGSGTGNDLLRVYHIVITNVSMWCK